MSRIHLWKETSPVARTRFYLTSALVVALLSILVAPRPLVFPLDDPYITIHNADVLLSGVDHNYSTSALTGATSEIHLLLVAFGTLFLPSSVALFMIGMASAVFYATGLARIAFQLGASCVTAALFVALGVLCGSTPFQLLNGLETGLAMAVVTWALSFALERSRSVRLPLLCGLMPFVRPELAALSGLLMARQFWMRVRAGEHKWAIRDVLIAAGIALPFLTWTWLSIGSLIPTTANAKQLYFADQHAPWKAKAGMLIVGMLQSGLLPLAALAALAWRSRLWTPLFLYVVSFLFALWATFPGGFIHNYGRYFFVLMPVFLYLTLDYLKTSRLSGMWFVILAGWTALMLPVGMNDYYADELLTAREYVSLAKWVNTNLPPDATLLIHDAGYLSYATSFRLVDLVGLKTPRNVVYHRACTAPTEGKDRRLAVSSIAMTSGATYAVIMQDTAGFWSSLARDLESTGWHLREVRAPAIRRGYAVYALTPPADSSVACRIAGPTLTALHR
ncbi:hypothetical protein NOV72_04399 [Caballeronia novacaledonica]|uniref:Glycosyltransferase RgtA/B/C/D-like domain-containing protein n=1 Tax=Caballeronia novacaledonica TaxID=1544861 RepID=A0A2U3IAP6_9BURK|nr:hypothetical protein [Caballeronia novacaledonica]SPB17195.1 hypothetical protein NOV72_04399 [Caballeronia novacaledonica]